MVDTSLLGVGLYAIPEAARLLKVPTAKLRRWAKGYTFRSGDTAGKSPPVISRQLADYADALGQPVLTFRDLIELQFVAYFSGEGVHLRTIRKAADKAAALFGTDHPFGSAGFATDGRDIFAVMREEGSPGDQAHVQQLVLCQFVFDSMVVPTFRKLELEDRQAGRYWPLGPDRGVVLDPRRRFGKPIDSGSGVPTFVLYQATQSGESRSAIAKWYDVPEQAITDAVDYEEWLAA